MQFRKIGNGTPIIFLPGLFAGGWIWDGIIDKCIEEGFSAFVFNNAIPVAFGNSFKQAVKLLDIALEECKEKPFLVGNSLGALISLHYTLQNPSRIQGLVMSGAPGLIELEAGVQLSQVRTGQIQHAYTLISNVFYNKSKIPEQGVKEIAFLFRNRELFSNSVRWLAFSRKYDIPGTLQQLELPIHFIWGEYDSITPAEPWVNLAKQFENIQASIITECGHSPMFELPQCFLDALLPMLHRTMEGSPLIKKIISK